MKQDFSPRPRAGPHFWLAVLAISLGILGIGELLPRRDTLTLLYDVPSPRLIVVGLVGFALVDGSPVPDLVIPPCTDGAPAPRASHDVLHVPLPRRQYHLALE